MGRTEKKGDDLGTFVQDASEAGYGLSSIAAGLKHILKTTEPERAAIAVQEEKMQKASDERRRERRRRKN
ncbi:MAG: hypothetical protein GF381_03705 [Candidatus Pacebacteria bacterium]|nr:hypothetical protein [Candidatus Paceibacterota bacterium]